MRLFSIKFITTACLVGILMCLLTALSCERYKKRVTIVYTHDLMGTLEPCG